MAFRTDIITPGAGFFLPADKDFNTEYGLNPGDVIGLNPGYYGYIDIPRMNGITFVNNGGLVEIGEVKFGVNAINPKLLGNNHAGLQYGIKITNPDRFAIAWQALGDIEIAGIEIDGSQLGMNISTLPGEYLYNQNVHLHHCYIHNTLYEAVYFGHDSLGGAFMNCNIHDLVIKNVGNDGIQCRNGYFNIHHNDIDGTGLGGDQNHAHGILIGGNTKNSLVKYNKLRNIGFYGLFCNGYGNIDMIGNDVESTSSSVMVKNHQPAEDLQGVGYQNVRIKGNILTPTNSIPLDAFYNDNGIAMAVEYTGNKATGTVNVQAGVTFTESNNGPGEVPVTGEEVPTLPEIPEVKKKRRSTFLGSRRF